MGASNSALSDQALEYYQKHTYFTKKEILHVHKRFQEVVPGQQGADFDVLTKVPMKSVLQLEELRVGIAYNHRVRTLCLTLCLLKFEFGPFKHFPHNNFLVVGEPVW